MPVVFGKPGSIRVRGLVRAQIRRCRQMCESVLAADLKGKNLPLPVILLTPAERAAFVTTSADCQVLLQQKN